MTTLVAPPTTTTPTLPLAKSSQDRSNSPLRNSGTPVINQSATPKQQPARSSPRTNASPETAARSPPSGKTSPNAGSSRPSAPLIRVKKEPASPNMASRPRPRRLDLSSSASASRGPQTAGAGPLASKESAGLAIKDLGVACLSPGFQTQDPDLRAQLQRSLSVRDQQRQLIEARQKGPVKSITSQDNAVADGGHHTAGDGGLPSARKKGPPPGLSIHAPSAAAFAHERVIQSAPLHQSFTGLRSHNAHPLPARNITQPSQVHHVAASQTSNRLPPISDVFAAERMDAPPSASFRPAVPPPAPSPGHPPMQSPGFPPPHHHHHHQHEQSQQPSTSRSREFRSAEEAVQNMAAGREELLPKIVHYGGAQPPTPPSPGGHHHPQHREYQSGHPAPHHAHHHQSHIPAPGPYDSRPELSRTSSMSGRRRTREEYERDHGSPNIQQEQFKRYTREREEEDWRHGMGSREKKEEFLRLCERAWDLFHS
ncbi:hypothetical protein K461DRAFT_91583 [Myriangium duriaei CBS 260.36]|uniref:Uncharacterized protein n=1 Tax=Myriangium duriaei CBS 260.36 TaxID=1168546 RepID=A0A9P4J6V4_9PEZI|nr:hypothetical protein K461DRAFT_91583 [Myriangium duriaei CBS 260.36]